jgi:hypothetical protein
VSEEGRGAILMELNGVHNAHALWWHACDASMDIKILIRIIRLSPAVNRSPSAKNFI